MFSFYTAFMMLELITAFFNFCLLWGEKLLFKCYIEACTSMLNVISYVVGNC